MPTVTIEGDVVVVSDPDCRPSERRMSRAEAFAGSGRMLFVRDPDRLIELLRDLAARLPALPGRDGVRQRYWRRWTPVPARRFAWGDAWLDVEGGIARVPPRAGELVPWQPLDDLLVHGPIQPCIPPDVRAALIAHLGADPADAFPAMDHEIARRDWTWNQRDDGEEGATLSGATVTTGYQFGHDMGWGDHAVERVYTRAPEIFLSAPAPMIEEIHAALATAVAG